MTYLYFPRFNDVVLPVISYAFFPDESRPQGVYEVHFKRAAAWECAFHRSHRRLYDNQRIKYCILFVTVSVKAP